MHESELGKNGKEKKKEVRERKRGRKYNYVTYNSPKLNSDTEEPGQWKLTLVNCIFMTSPEPGALPMSSHLVLTVGAEGKLQARKRRLRC